MDIGKILIAIITIVAVVYYFVTRPPVTLASKDNYYAVFKNRKQKKIRYRLSAPQQMRIQFMQDEVPSAKMRNLGVIKDLHYRHWSDRVWETLRKKDLKKPADRVCKSDLFMKKAERMQIVALNPEVADSLSSVGEKLILAIDHPCGRIFEAKMTGQCIIGVEVQSKPDDKRWSKIKKSEVFENCQSFLVTRPASLTRLKSGLLQN